MRCLGTASLLALLLAAPRAEAAVVLALSLDDLLERSSVVCVSRVEAVASRWRRGRIVTDVHAVCERGLEGASDGEPISWVTEGGTVGDVGARVPGEPVFRPGDSALVFLSEAAGALRVTGMAQGAVFVTGPAGRERVGPAGTGAALVRRGRAGRLVPVRGWLPEPRPLAEVLSEIEARLRATE